MEITFRQLHDAILAARNFHNLIHMDVDMAKSQKSKNNSLPFNPPRKSTNQSPLTIGDDSGSDDAPLEFDFGAGSNKSGKSNRVEVDADSNQEGEVIVGEDLFMEMCDAWISVHGHEAIVKALAKNKQLIQDAVVVAVKAGKLGKANVK